MNISKFLTLLLLTFITFCSCTQDTEPFIDITQPNEIDCPQSSTTELNFISHTSWTATITSGSEWLELSNSKGDGNTTDKQTITLTALSSNNTNADRVAKITITSDFISKDVEVIQNPAFILKESVIYVGAEGGSITIPFETNADANEINFTFNNNTLEDLKKMIPVLFDTRQANTRSLNNEFKLSLPIAKNESKSQLIGSMNLVNMSNGTISEIIQIIQEGNNASQGIETKNDGIVKNLQTHSKGAGIPIVLMGDGFQNSDMEDGTYNEVMSEAMQYFFSVEPMTTHKDYFDVYSVSAVSENIYFGSSTTALGCKFGVNTNSITGDYDKCKEYALKAITEAQLNDAVIIVILNSNRHAGTCLLDTNIIKNDYANGLAIAFIPRSEAYGGKDFEYILHHEAIGHGFGKLGDEYYLEEKGTFSKDEIEELKTYHTYSFFTNVDVYADVTQTLWSRLAADPLYANEGLGAYEGGFTYKKGVYRPTQTSIMVNNVGQFNAPSREAIYKRIMHIANNHNYTYKYEDFVKYDAINRSQNTRAYSRQTEKSSLPPLPPPILKKLQ